MKEWQKMMNVLKFLKISLFFCIYAFCPFPFIQRYRGSKGYHSCKPNVNHMMMTWTAESVTVQGFRFYFGVVPRTSFFKIDPWTALPLQKPCFYEYISSPPESCCLCALSPLPEMGGIFLPNPCDFFTWIFHGGNVWRVSVFFCPLAMQIHMLSELVPAWGRREVASWGKEGLTHDLVWKLRVSL